MSTDTTDTLYTSYQHLLQSSKAFFSLPTSEKEAFKTSLGSEDGWSRVEGEKEFITLRSLESTPEILKEAAIKYWAEAGGLLNEILAKIEESLGLSEGALTVYSEPCSKLGVKTATMLRLFRYEGFEGKQSKVVAEGRTFVLVQDSVRDFLLTCGISASRSRLTQSGRGRYSRSRSP